MDFKDLLQTKTVIGTILLILAYLTDPNTLAALGAIVTIPAWVTPLLTVVGGLLTAIGVRSAIQKSGPTG